MEIFGIDLGGTTFTSGAVDEHGAVSHHAEEPTRGWEGADKLLPRLAAAVSSARETSGLKNAAVGIGVPGVVKHGDGICVYAPNINGWNGLPVTQQLTQHLGIPAFIINDANAAALAEARFGAGRGKNEVLVLTLGTGIGSGLILDGKLRLGASERGSEIGHITIDIDASTGSAGNTGTAESVCGRDAIITRARRRLERGRDSAMFDLCGGDMTQLTPRLVAEAAAGGDDAAREVWEETAWYLSAVIVNVVFTCDIERVVIAGGVAQAGEILFAPLRRAVAARTSMLPFDTREIVAAELGPQAGLIGAAQWARERVAER